MDEMNWTLPPDLDAATQKYYKGPGASPEFVSRLDRELRNHPSRLSFPWKNKDHFMQSLRARPALAVLLAILALLFLTGVAYAIGRLSGYIPEFGFTSGNPYVLAAPVQISQNGVKVRIEQAVYDASGLWLKLNVSGLPEVGQHPQAYILSESGERMQSQQGGAINPEAAIWQLTYMFSKIEDPRTPITLTLENMGGQSVSLTFALRPARTDEVLPALSGSSLPMQGEIQDHMALVLESVAISTDRTVLQVSLHFDQKGIDVAAPWDVMMTDDRGHIYPLTDISPETMNINVNRLYQTVPLQGNEQLILKLVSFPSESDLPMLMDMSSNPPTFMFDAGTDPQVGQTWSLDETLQAGPFSIHLVSARLHSPTELIFEFEPSNHVTGVMLYSTLANGSYGGVPVQNKNFSASMTFAKVPSTPFEIELGRVYYTAGGPWRLEWQAPAAAILNFPTMTPAPSPTPLTIPTLTSQDPILLEVEALAQRFDHSITRDPAWIHVVYENTSENIPAGQTYPPPYYKDEQWYEIDGAGWVTRSLITHYDANGNILQQSASIGTKGINFTTGDVFENSPYRLSFDFLTRDLDSALSREQPIQREETTCDDGSKCLLITVREQYSSPIQNPGQPVAFYGGGLRVWIAVETGQQVKHESFSQLEDGTEQIRYTQRVLLAEKVSAPPDEVLKILDRILP